MRIVFVLGLTLVLAGSSWARGNELVSLRDVPEGARRSADQAAPGVTWFIAKKDNQGGYFILGKDAKKHLVEFLTDATGRKHAVRIKISMEDVPQVVTAALKVKMPGFRPKEAQACGVDMRSITVYRFQGEGFEGGNAGVYVSANGKRVSPISARD